MVGHRWRRNTHGEHSESGDYCSRLERAGSPDRAEANWTALPGGVHTFWGMSVNGNRATDNVLVNRLASTPPSKRRYAVACLHRGCNFVWYYYSDWEAWQSRSQHQHANALHVFEYVYRGKKQASSGFTLYKQRWIELLEFRDADLQATS